MEEIIATHIYSLAELELQRSVHALKCECWIGLNFIFCFSWLSGKAVVGVAFISYIGGCRPHETNTICKRDQDSMIANSSKTRTIPPYQTTEIFPIKSPKSSSRRTIGSDQDSMIVDYKEGEDSRKPRTIPPDETTETVPIVSPKSPKSSSKRNIKTIGGKRTKRKEIGGAG